MLTQDVLSLARYLIGLGTESQRPLTNKKLQKLLYYSQAWSLVLREKSLFDEQIEAWTHGPVVPSIYHHYKGFGFGFIQDKDKNPFVISVLSKEIREHLDEVWRVYGKYDADYLEALTHSENPWIQARSFLDDQKNSNAIISNESMKAFYSRFLKDNTNDEE